MRSKGTLSLSHIRPATQQPSQTCQILSCHHRRIHWRPRYPRTKLRKVPMRNTFPTFEASPLLIDLDAEDCRAVRQYEPDLDGTPHKSMKPRHFELKVLKKRFNEFNKQSRREETRFAEVCRNIHSPWRVTDVDVLSAVLLGSQGYTARLPRPPTKDEGSHRRVMWTVLARNGVQSDIRDRVPSITQYLLRRQKLAWRTTMGRNDAGGFRAAIESTKDPIELERITSNAMQTAEGRAVVATMSSVVAERCQSFAIRPRKLRWNIYLQRLEHLLCLVNNIIINFRHHNLQPPISLQMVAKKLAKKCGVQLAPVVEEPRISSPWKRLWAQSSEQSQHTEDAPPDVENYHIRRHDTPRQLRELPPANAERIAMID